MLNVFRVIAFAEAVSYLVLLLIAVPLKYFADMPHAVAWPGRIHGGLFIAYLIVLTLLARKHKLPVNLTALAALASIIPAGPFIIDGKVKAACQAAA